MITILSSFPIAHIYILRFAIMQTEYFIHIYTLMFRDYLTLVVVTYLIYKSATLLKSFYSIFVLNVYQTNLLSSGFSLFVLPFPFVFLVSYVLYYFFCFCIHYSTTAALVCLRSSDISFQVFPSKEAIKCK